MEAAIKVFLPEHLWQMIYKVVQQGQYLGFKNQQTTFEW